jgi:CPA1 family monovalent cation:H+ antiporter
MNTATLLLTLLFAGLSSQWLAWRFQIPAIVVLITVGLILGPVSGFIAPGMSPHDLADLIGLGVAIILLKAAWT